MSSQVSPRTQLQEELQLQLGGQMVDVELDPAHYNLAITVGIEKLRQQSDGSMLEKDIFLHVTRNIQEYTLPEEVQEVRRLYRRGVGPWSNGGVNFDPTSGMVADAMLLQGAGGGNGTAGLATWDFFNGYLKTVEQVFASQYNFVWDVNTHTLRLIRRPTGDEDVIVRVWSKRSEDTIITDPYMRPWLRSYATAMCKMYLGEARSKFTSGFPGPTGNVTFNGDQLKQEAQAEILKLEKELLNIVTGPDGYGFTIG